MQAMLESSSTSHDAEITCISFLPAGWRRERPPSASQRLRDGRNISIGAAP